MLALGIAGTFKIIGLALFPLVVVYFWKTEAIIRTTEKVVWFI